MATKKKVVKKTTPKKAVKKAAPKKKPSDIWDKKTEEGLAKCKKLSLQNGNNFVFIVSENKDGILEGYSQAVGNLSLLKIASTIGRTLSRIQEAE